MFLSALIIFARNWQRTYFSFFRVIFDILVMSVWWRFVAMLRSKEDVPNDQVNQWFPWLLSPFDWWTPRMFTILTIYVCLLLVTSKWNIEYPKWIFFLYIILWYSATKIYLFLPFLGLQDSLIWSGYLEMFIKNGFRHGVLQGFPHCFIQFLMFQKFSFSVASILSSL